MRHNCKLRISTVWQRNATLLNFSRSYENPARAPFSRRQRNFNSSQNWGYLASIGNHALELLEGIAVLQSILAPVDIWHLLKGVYIASMPNLGLGGELWT